MKTFLITLFLTISIAVSAQASLYSDRAQVNKFKAGDKYLCELNSGVQYYLEVGTYQVTFGGVVFSISNFGFYRAPGIANAVILDRVNHTAQYGFSRMTCTQEN